MICFAPGLGGAYVFLSLPATAARQLLVPAALALAFESVRSPSVGLVASTAAAGCGPTAEKLYPYVSPPENIVPGVAVHFATVCRECSTGCGVLAKNRDGRIIKLEGNPSFPATGGALCIAGQAALQGLYHPDRYRGALSAGKPIAWDAAEKQVADKVGALVNNSTKASTAAG